MSKGALTAIIVGVVVAIGGGLAFWIANQPTDEQSSTEQVATENQKVAETNSTASVMDFLKAGNNKECTYTEDDVTGTMYFASGERLRMDFNETNEDNPSNGGMIIAADKRYVWDNREKTGFVFTRTDDDVNNDDIDESLQVDDDTLDMDEEYSFSCKNWQVDSSKFTPPAGIEFQDFSAIMEQQQTN